MSDRCCQFLLTNACYQFMMERWNPLKVSFGILFRFAFYFFWHFISFWHLLHCCCFAHVALLLQGHVGIITAFNFPCAVFFWKSVTHLSLQFSHCVHFSAALSLVAGNTQVRIACDLIHLNDRCLRVCRYGKEANLAP